MNRRRAARGAALLGLAALSGCGWFSSSSSEPAGLQCPSAIILRSLANTAIFGPGTERRPENVAFYGLLSEVDTKCTAGADAMHARLDVIVIGQRGAAAKGDVVDLPYFVAVTGPDQSVLSRNSFTVRIAFEPGKARAGVTDHIDESIPLRGHKPSELSLYLGFEQSPDAIEFYKRFRGR